MKARVVFSSSNHKKIEPLSRPHVVEAPPDEPFREVFKVPLGEEFLVHAVDFFIGQDRGDRAESSITVFAGDGRYLAGAVLEKETVGVSWRRPRVFLPLPVQVRALAIHVLSRVTGESLIDIREHPSYKRWRAVMDWNVVLIGEDVER